jgi:hypothetical protein
VQIIEPGLEVEVTGPHFSIKIYPGKLRPEFDPNPILDPGARTVEFGVAERAVEAGDHEGAE